MKCGKCGYETQSFFLFHEHLYMHVAEDYRREQRLKELHEELAMAKERAEYHSPNHIVQMGPSCMYQDALDEISDIERAIKKLS